MDGKPIITVPLESRVLNSDYPRAEAEVGTVAIIDIGLVVPVWWADKAHKKYNWGWER